MSDPQNPPPSGPAQAVLGQLRLLADRLSSIPGRESLQLRSALAGLGALPGFTPPGAMSAAQLQAVASMLTAQRTGISAMQAQLVAFDEQLDVLQRLLEPLVAWSSTWADLERGLLDLRPGAGDGPHEPETSA